MVENPLKYHTVPRMRERVTARKQAILDHAFLVLVTLDNRENITPRHMREVEEFCRDHRRVLAGMGVTRFELEGMYRNTTPNEPPSGFEALLFGDEIPNGKPA